MRKANGNAEPHNVRYWSIGNENYLGGEIGAKTVEEWGPLVRESAKMMRAVDSQLKILAAATVDGDWTPPMLKAAGKYLDYISIHGYWDALWQHGTHPSDYLHCMARCQQPEQQIQKAIGLLTQTGLADHIKIAFDEWNLRGWHHPGFPGGGANNLDKIRERDENDLNETYTMADAVFSASFLNGCLRHADSVHMAGLAPVVNARGPLFVHPKGIVKRTTFHVLGMYSNLLQPNVVAGQIVSEDLRVDQGQYRRLTHSPPAAMTAATSPRIHQSSPGTACPLDSRYRSGKKDGKNKCHHPKRRLDGCLQRCGPSRSCRSRGT